MTIQFNKPNRYSFFPATTLNTTPNTTPNIKLLTFPVFVVIDTNTNTNSSLYT